MELDSEALFRKLKQDVSSYIGLKFELLKLNTYERTGKVISVLSYGMILILLGFFVLLFLFMTIGFFLGNMFDSQAGGFACVVLLYLILIALVVSNKTRIMNTVLNTVIAALRGNEDNKEENNEEITVDNNTKVNEEQQSDPDATAEAVK